MSVNLSELVIINSLKINQDHRGYLIECWRKDNDLFFKMLNKPEMMYISWTMPGKKRGPHLHEYQWDLFTFPGPGLFEICLWEYNNPNNKLKIEAGADQPKTIVIPSYIVHAYKNISMISGLVINCPDNLYRGEFKQEPEDIIRFEDDPNNPYIF